jgi:hypothetical protein
MKYFSFKKILGYVTAVVFILAGSIHHAQARIATYTLLEPLPCSGLAIENCSGGVIKEIAVDSFLKYVYLLMLSLGAVLSVIMIMAAGFQYITSEIVDTKSEAKKRAQNAVIGLILMLSTYLILNTINPKLVNVTYTLPTIQSTGAGTKALNDLLQSAEDRSRLIEEQAKKNQLAIDEQFDKVKKLKAQASELERTGNPEKITEAQNLKDQAQKLEISTNITEYKNAVELSYEQKLLVITKNNTDNTSARIAYGILIGDINTKTSSYVAKLKELGAADDADTLEKDYRSFYTQKAAMDAATRGVIQDIETHPLIPQSSGGVGSAIPGVGTIVSGMRVVDSVVNIANQKTRTYDLERAQDLLDHLKKGEGEIPTNPTDIIARSLGDKTDMKYATLSIPQNPALASQLKANRDALISSLQRTLDAAGVKKKP